jgi:hypothetical protein
MNDMAIVNVKAENNTEDVRKISEEINILCSGHRGELSDGYHTFNELYRHRITLFIYIAKKHAECGGSVYRFHHYEGWFCLGLETEHGQISYHIPKSQWEKCDFAGYERQPEFDGHTSEDVLRRLELLMG